jgi:hypothetical protein
LITPNTGMVNNHIFFNLDKTRYIKRDGEWLYPLRFLGLEYDGKLDKLKGSTRKGSTLLYDKAELIKALNEELPNHPKYSNTGFKFQTPWAELIK